MLALAAAGDVPGALRHAEIFTEFRQGQLELPADSEVLTLAERIRRGEMPPAPLRSARSDAVPTAPPAPHSIDRPAPDRPASIAVLPFVNMSPDRENEYFSDGLTEELTNALTQVAGLRVASRTSAFAFKGKEVDAREIGARLGVLLLVEGSVRKLGNRIRVTAQMVDAGNGYHLWSQAFDRTLTDVFALQEEVAHAIVAVRPPTDVVEAYTLYLRARYFILKGDADSVRVALEYFEQALELDPQFALAYAGLAQCWVFSGFQFGELPPLEVMPRAKLAVDRALELDPMLAEGHLWRGVIALLYEYDPVEAEARVTRAIELQPSAVHAHVWRSILRSLAGRHDEAIAEALEAERLDPIALRVQFALGRGYYHAGRFDEARRRFQTVLGMDPNSIAHAWMAWTCNWAGQADLGLAAAETGLARIGRQPILLAALGGCLAAMGRGDEARSVIAELDQLARRRYVSAYYAGIIHARLGEAEAAMRCLEQAARERSGHVPFSLTNNYASLHKTPEFRALMERLGLQMLNAGAQGESSSRGGCLTQDL
jgi:serine/threonine-protein kinase